MKFLSAADFDDAITAASKIRAATSYALLAVGAANTAYTSGNFEAYVPVGQYATGVRPGYGFYAAGVLGTYLYAETAAELRLRTSTGLDYTMWNSGNSRSDAQNDTRYSQLGHTHVIADITGLQTALDSKATASGTVGKVPKYATGNSFVDSIITEVSSSTVRVSGVIQSDTAIADVNARGLTILTGSVGRWITGKAGAENIGTNAGSDYVFWRLDDAGTYLGEALRLSRANGNATFSGSITASGGNSGNWNTAFSWGNHASAGYALSSALSGYVPTSRTITINGTTFDLSANRTWTISAGVGGTGTANNYALWTSTSNVGVGSLSEDSNYVISGKSVRIGFQSGGTNRHIESYHSTSLAALYFLKPSLDEGWVYGYAADDFNFQYAHPTNPQRIFQFKANGQFVLDIPTGTAPFGLVSTTMSPNLNADMVDGLHASSFALASSLSGYVPTTRTITINGTTFDLSANRSWTISGGGLSGTANYYARFASGGVTAGDGFIYDNGTNRVYMNATLQVNPAAWPKFLLSGDASNTYIHFADATPTSLAWINGQATKLVFAVGGTEVFRMNYSTLDLTVQKAITIGGTGAVLNVASTALNPNFNADMVDGLHASSFALASNLSANYYQKTTIDTMLTGYVPDSRSVSGTGSIQGGGNLGVNRSFNLYGDLDSPGASKYYGTNSSGAKGWYSLPTGGGSGYVPESRVITINGVSWDLSMDRSWTISTGVSGSGTSFRMAVWSSSSSITASSIMTDTGSQITIGGHLTINGGLVNMGTFSGAPSSPVQGSWYYDTSLNKPRYYNGSSWVTL